MPLPRFERLPAQKRSEILAIARRHFAEQGREGAALLTVAQDAGLSRAAFYNYFDGKDDLFETVRIETITRVGRALGPWTPQQSTAAFWTAFADAQRRLEAALAEHPDDRAVLATARGGVEADDWTRAVFDNAVALGLVDTTVGAPLLAAITAATLVAADGVELAQPGSVPADTLRAVLERLWGTR